MDCRVVLFTLLIVSIVGGQAAFGAQLASVINPNEPSSGFEMKYERTVFIHYGDGGQVAEQLRGNSWSVEAAGSAPAPDIVALRDTINKKIATDGSATQIDELSVEYRALLTGREKSATIDYKITLEGTLVGYNIASEGGVAGKKLVDLGWRGMTAGGPAVIDGAEVNIPLSAIVANEPELHSLMAGSAAERLLNMPLINADGIRDQHIDNWHSLFDPAGISVDAGTFGLDEEISGFVVTGMTMGESSFREGRQVESNTEAEFTADKTYKVETIQYADSANISLIGFAVRDNLGGLEIVGVTPEAPPGYSNTSTGDFPVVIIYGMAGLAAVGGGVFFVFSNRQLKKEHDQGQTGIDPSRLTGYQTSASAGGYQTNRGEAQLRDGGDYAQTRSVYDSASSGTPAVSAPSPDASCGCAASADSGNECDCQMQGQCLCDATCGCGSGVCKDAVSQMQ